MPLRYTTGGKPRLLSKSKRGNKELREIFDHAARAVMCRVHYLCFPRPLPTADDIPGLAKYWKDHYNTYRGAGRKRSLSVTFLRLVYKKKPYCKDTCKTQNTCKAQ